MTSKAVANAVACVIGTAGHIDHGKTSLVRALTGMDTDMLPEEKKRGISINLGFAQMEIDVPGGVPVRAAFVDVPGHERFIKNMLAGATGMNFVLFAVAADDGVMPQTIEHLDVLRFLGVRRGIVVITKADLVPRTRVEEVKAEVRGLIKSTPLAASPVIGVSTVTGEGMDELRALIKAAAAQPPPDDAACTGGGFSGLPPKPEGFFRLPIDRAFVLRGFGTVVTGTVASGTVKKGAELILFPGGRRVRVRGLQSLHAAVDAAACGSRAALNLTGVAHTEIKRGAVLASPGLSGYVEFASANKIQYVDALFDFTGGAGPVDGKRGMLRVYHLTADAHCRVVLAGGRNSDGLFPGRLVLRGPLLMLTGDRFVIRDVSRNRTIGGGTVVIPYFSKAEAVSLKSTAIFGAAGASALAKAYVHEKGFVHADDARVRFNAGEGFFERLTEEPAGRLVMLGDFIVSAGLLDRTEGAAVEAVSGHHNAAPLDAGAGEDALMARLRKAAGAMPEALARLVIDGLVSAGKLRKNGSIVSLPGFSASAGNAQGELEKAVLAAVPQGFTAASHVDIMRLPFKKADIEKVLAYLQRSGSVVRLTEGSYISGAAVKEARGRLEALVGEKGGVTASGFRDALGCGRKLAIEILEYFDRERVTIRRGDERVLRHVPASLKRG